MTLFSIKQLGRIGVSSEKALLQQHNSKDDPTTIAQAIRMEVLSAAHMGRALVHRSQILEAWTLARFRSPAQIAPCSPRLKRDSYRRFLGCRSWKGRHGPNVSQTECAQRTAASVLAFAQQQFERCLPCAMSLRHGLEIDLGLLDWRCPPGAIDRPPPWLLSPSPVLDDYGKVAVVDHGVDIKAKLGFESTEQRDREAWAVHRR